jgi:hypothetical protein
MSSIVDQQTGRFNARLHVRQLKGNPLKLADLLSKCLALPGVGQAGLIGGFGNTQGLRGNANPSCIEDGHGDFEAFPFFAKPVFDRNPVILENDLAGGRGTDAQLGLLLAANKPGWVASIIKAVIPLGVSARVRSS